MIGAGISALVLAVVAFISQIWLTAVGSSLTAAAAIGLAWTTRPRRDS